MFSRLPWTTLRMSALLGLLAGIGGFIVLRAVHPEEKAARPILPGVLSPRMAAPVVVAPTGPHPFCPSHPRTSWLSVVEVEIILKQRGFDLVQIRMVDDKCYAVSTRNSTGQIRDFFLHPVTAEFIRQTP